MGTIQFLDVGFGDTTVITTDSGTILIDCHDVARHAKLLPSTKKLKAVLITHQHYDHFDGLSYLKDSGYSIEFFIYSPYERRRGDASVALDEWNAFRSHADYFKDNGSKVYTPHRQDKWEKPWWEPCGLKVWLIGPEKGMATSETRELHDASLVFRIDGGSRKCLFTGDASDTSLNWIANNTKNYCDDILHASHHGSINGADLDFIKKAKAVDTIISTKSGVKDNVPHPTAISRYQANTSKKVYRTDVSGTLSCTFQA